MVYKSSEHIKKELAQMSYAKLKSFFLGPVFFSVHSVFHMYDKHSFVWNIAPHF